MWLHDRGRSLSIVAPIKPFQIQPIQTNRRELSLPSRFNSGLFMCWMRCRRLCMPHTAHVTPRGSKMACLSAEALLQMPEHRHMGRLDSDVAAGKLTSQSDDHYWEDGWVFDGAANTATVVAWCACRISGPARPCHGCVTTPHSVPAISLRRGSITNVAPATLGPGQPARQGSVPSLGRPRDPRSRSRP